MADIKGDFSGIAAAGKPDDKMKARLAERKLPEPKWQACPVTLWDIWGEHGHPVRATVSDMGPLLFARLLALNETQEGVLSLVFKVADDNGLLLLDLKDLRAILQYVGDNAAQFKTQYGNVSSASIGAIQRGLLQLEEQGGERFFGEPMLDIADLMQTTDGKGVVNVLAADKMMNNPRLYASFLLWLLAELFENLPEVGDRDKPKLVFFFDEAHLAVQRRAGRAAGESRAGCAIDSLEGRRRVLRHAKPARHSRQGAGPARQPRAARAARVHSARSEGGEVGGRDDARQSEDRCDQGDSRACGRRSTGQLP